MPRIVPYDHQRHAGGPWRVVKAVFDEFGFPFVESDYDADVADPATHYAGPGNGFAVAEHDDGTVVGCVGITDEGDGVSELHRLYVLAEARKDGLGGQLVQWVADQAHEHNARKLVLYSDVHFEDAHRLYLRHGFRCVVFRYAPDPWKSREWGFERWLS